MKRDKNGRIVASIAGGESVRAFVPAPLPPVPALNLSGPLQAKLERATLALGRLDSVSVLLPDPQLFLYAYVRREAVLSSQIEGTQSSLSDLLLYELDGVPGAPFDDVAEVSNYVAALNHGMARLTEGFPLCNRLLCEMHAKLMAGGRGSEKLPGEFRRSQNWIGGTRPGNAHFVPPPPQEVDACMGELERFINDAASGQSVLIKAALAHVQFETIHPFLDGNGRLGRLLIALMLHESKALGQPLLYLSLYFKQHRRVYYDLLDSVRQEGDWEAWVEFFLEGVEETASGAVQTARRLVALFEHDQSALKAKRGSSSLIHALNALRQRPVSSIGQVAQLSGLTFPTASKALQTLTEEKIVKELTNRRRNRVFVYDAYLQILNEGGETF